MKKLQILPWRLEYKFWPQFNPTPHVLLSPSYPNIAVDPSWQYYDEWQQWLVHNVPKECYDASRCGQVRFTTKPLAVMFKLAWEGKQ